MVDDRGLQRLPSLRRLDRGRGCFFVTRLKDNAQFEVVAEREPPQHRQILTDQTIRLSGLGAQAKCPHLLAPHRSRSEADTGEHPRLLDQPSRLGREHRAAIYKDRWQIELFFKALKQNLKIKTFVGTSAECG